MIMGKSSIISPLHLTLNKDDTAEIEQVSTLTHAAERKLPGGGVLPPDYDCERALSTSTLSNENGKASAGTMTVYSTMSSSRSMRGSTGSRGEARRGAPQAQADGVRQQDGGG